MRYYYIDVLKIINAFCIVLLHTTALGLYSIEQPNWWHFVVLNSLTRFAVPLFVLCSGAMLLLPEKNKGSSFSLLAVRLKRLGIPLLFWSALYELHLISCGVDKSIGVCIQDFLSGNIMYHLWFLYMLISVYVVAPIIYGLDSKIEKYILYVWMGFLVFRFIGYCVQVQISPYIFFLSPYICYFILGRYIHDVVKQARLFWGETELGWELCLLVILICIFVIAYGTMRVTRNSLNEMFFANDNLFVVFGSLIIFFVFRSKEEFFKKFCNRRILSYCNSLTMGIYLIHVYVLDILYYRFAGGNFYSFRHPVLVSFALAVIVFIISMFLTALIRKIPLLRQVV